MNDWLPDFQYVAAWAIYLASGAVLCFFWWKAMRKIQHPGWRDLLRGIALVLIFTPCFSDQNHEHYAPASLVALMELLLRGTGQGLAAIMMLLFASGLLLAILFIRHKKRTATEPF